RPDVVAPAGEHVAENPGRGRLVAGREPGRRGGERQPGGVVHRRGGGGPFGRGQVPLGGGHVAQRGGDQRGLGRPDDHVLHDAGRRGAVEQTGQRGHDLVDLAAGPAERQPDRKSVV